MPAAVASRRNCVSHHVDIRGLFDLDLYLRVVVLMAMFPASVHCDLFEERARENLTIEVRSRRRLNEARPIEDRRRAADHGTCSHCEHQTWGFAVHIIPPARGCDQRFKYLRVFAHPNW